MINMGIGELGGPSLVFKRKFRWTFQVNNVCGGQVRVPEHFVKLAARPNITIEETEINFLNAKTWIPGKGTWETITVTYYDVSQAGNGVGNEGLWSWLATVYDFTSPIELQQSSTRESYGGDARLNLYDGCGTSMEEWLLHSVWPQAINFGELDYSSSEEVTIEVTLRYTDVEYFNFCGQDPSPCCEGC
jgi:hypothetical protein